jgi:hypothetical protein
MDRNNIDTRREIQKLPSKLRIRVGALAHESHYYQKPYSVANPAINFIYL